MSLTVGKMKKIYLAKLDCLHQMLSFIKNYAQKIGFSSPILDKVILAAEEALVNIINYGYPGDAGTIEIICENCSSRSGIKIVIKDQGIPFNPIGQNQGFSPERVENSNVDIGGYGIYIFVGVMDRVDYQRIEGGNRLSLIKYL